MKNSSLSDRRADHAEVPHTFYQIDFGSENCGRIIPMSKRHIHFKFGYPNVRAMKDGLSGQDCRGEEHEISIVWSLSSGKQSIEYDGEIIFWNVCNLSDGKMTHSWSDKDGRYLKVIVHSLSISMNAAQHADWRQYDLFIDGISYFRAPKIYQIGVFAKNYSGGNTLLDFVGSRNVRSEQPPPVKPAEPLHAEVVDLLSFDEVPPVTSNPRLQVVTQFGSPEYGNCSMSHRPLISYNAPQQKYINYTFEL